MNRFAGFLLFNLVASALASTVVPAQAQGFRINREYLPDGSKIERSRLKLQLVDTNPEITDHRHKKEQADFIINVPPVPQETPAPITVQAGETAAAPREGDAPAPLVAPKQPQESHFGSNIGSGSPQRMAPHRGSSPSLKWVAGRLTDKPVQKPLQQIQPQPQPAQSQPTKQTGEQHQSAPVRVAVYGPSPVTASAPFVQEISISARGHLLRSK